MTLAPGTRLGPYEITAKLGEGGMGEVYRATDTKLEREVAVKVLPAALTDDPDRLVRFEREAKVLASLNHPNIAQIYGLEIHGDAHALVMELVDGPTLAERLASGPLTVDEILAIGDQISDALDEAHTRGVVHRDLKPPNVIITPPGRVKLLDFGLAKRTEPEATELSTAVTELQTAAGLVIGTVPYMSPEQIQGWPVDRRTDIFSLGVLLYEMAAGERPFHGDNAAALSSSILRDEPQAVTDLHPKLPAGLGRVIHGCLEKDPAMRHPTAAVVRDRLREIAAGASSDTRAESKAPAAEGAERAVVVLPFANRSGDPDNEYFSDGLTEEVIADLSKVSALRTISRNSAMALKGESKDSGTVARELGVTHLVTGSVRRVGNALRVTAELVDALSDTAIWSEKSSGTVEDVFGIQEEIARQIVSALEVELTDSEARQVADRPIDDVVAYDCYLRARQEMYRWTPDSGQRAHRLVDEALGIVGNAPLLLATKGQLHWNDVNTNRVPRDEGLGRAEELAGRALETDPNLPLAVFVRGLVAGMRGELEKALPDLYRALELAPNDANLLAETCRFSNVGGLRRHRSLVDRLAAIDPLTAVTPLVASSYHWVSGHRDEIAAPARRVIELAPVPSMMHVVAGWQLAEAGHHDQAREILGRVGSERTGSLLGEWASFLERALAGDAEGALAHATADLEATIANEFAARIIADAFAAIGRHDNALRWLRRAIDFGFVNHPSITEHDSFLVDLRETAELQELMRSLEPRWRALVEWEHSYLADRERLGTR